MLLTTLLFHVVNMWRMAVSALRGAIGWVAQSPARIWAAAAVLMALVALWQHHQATDMAKQWRQAKAAWDAARTNAETAKAAAETRYRSLAHDADLNQSRLAADGDARLAAYIADHRVQPAAQADPAGAAQAGPSAVPANASADPVVAPVVVAEADLHTCDADYAYARAAYDWARGLAQ